MEANITLVDLTKRYRDTLAVDHLTIEVMPGRVTGFLGPNGAGKSTTLRMLLGLTVPTSGTALIGNRAYATLRDPLREVGALLDAGAIHPGRTAVAHLRAVARSNRIPLSRVTEVLETVGLGAAADRRVGEFSLGMQQRLGVATAILGDPGVLLFDEPVNGLDPEGVVWIRRLMRSMAAEGRTVLVSSHLMSEMEDTADQVIVMGRGRLLADAPMRELISGTAPTVRIRTPEFRPLRRALLDAGLTVEQTDTEELTVADVVPSDLGDIAHRIGARVHELTSTRSTLEDAYLQLTSDSVEYSSALPATVGAGRSES